jgi:hypothetical protein
MDRDQRWERINALDASCVQPYHVDGAGGAVQRQYDAE